MRLAIVCIVGLAIGWAAHQLLGAAGASPTQAALIVLGTLGGLVIAGGLWLGSQNNRRRR